MGNRQWMDFEGTLPFVLANDDEIGVTRFFADAVNHVACRLEPACALELLPGFFREERRGRTSVRSQLQGDLGSRPVRRGLA